ncbi:hypothetical protein [Kitasatospora sp. NPDC091207]|uniref:hypothetical protein n=1 Tax=Kitasatospora sp. NPDC091207 TaxID=3364083 RepID=UPI0037F31F04
MWSDPHPRYHAAAVAPSRTVVAIGVDAEPNQRLGNPDVLPLVSLAAERAWVERLLVRRPEVSWDRLLFSARASVYQACLPVVGPLGFDDALITVDPPAGTFRARVRLPWPAGRWSRSTRLTGRSWPEADVRSRGQEKRGFRTPTAARRPGGGGGDPAVRGRPAPADGPAGVVARLPGTGERDSAGGAGPQDTERLTPCQSSWFSCELV